MTRQRVENYEFLALITLKMECFLPQHLGNEDELCVDINDVNIIYETSIIPITDAFNNTAFQYLSHCG